MLSGQESTVLARFCELAAVDPVSYVERVLAGSLPDEEDRLHAALGLVARYLDALDRIAGTEGFQLLRTLAYGPRWTGPRVMASDENTGTVELAPAGKAVVTKGFSKQERRRLDDVLAFTTEVPRAAGARRVVWSGLSTSHVQGTVRMGADPARSVVDDRGRAHGVDGLYVGDGSVTPASMSAHPSLTIMALAAMIADNLAGELA
jgi:choline dehydrogenase-like flavoprotein